MNDYLVRCITTSANIRALACITTNLINEACRRHATFLTASIALGRALTGGALLGALLKDRQRVALKFEANGPLKKIIVEADSDGHIQGYVGAPNVDLPLKDGEPDVAGALGRAGFLIVTKDLGLKEPYKGMVQLYTSEIGEDIAYYLAESEQIPSAVGIGTVMGTSGIITAAGGFLIQSLPPANEELITELITRIKGIPSLSDLLQQGITPEELLRTIFNDIAIEILGSQPLSFTCSCSKERMERGLITLGRDELETIIKGRDEVEIVCDFCKERYLFGQEQLQRLLKNMS